MIINNFFADDETITLGAAAAGLKKLLAAGQVQSSQAEAEIILSEVMGCRRTALFLHFEERLEKEQLQAINQICERRLRHEPLQYILGKTGFMNLELMVSPAVLIPRPETEILVEFVCRHAPLNSKILDVGCGSGAIALSCAMERADVQVLGLDVSPDALAVAAANQKQNHLTNVCFRQSNLLEALNDDEYFELIAANLPYISEDEYTLLEAEVKDFEPKLALTAEKNGLELIEKCIMQLPGHLRPNGWAIFEIGMTQAEAVRQILLSYPIWAEVRIIPDYLQRDRFVAARRR